MEGAEMSSRQNLIAGLAVVGVLLMAAGQLLSQETSTSEERARWAEITHKLESNPLDESTNKDREWALKRSTAETTHSRSP
jgi:hypothetical protein